MLDPVLLSPDNRLLSFSTHDFSLYGGQTPAELHIGRAPLPPVIEKPAGNSPDAVSPGDDTSGESSGSEQLQISDASADAMAADTTGATAPLAQAASFAPAPLALTDGAIATPASFGSSFAPAIGPIGSPTASTAALASQTSELSTPLADTLSGLSALTDLPLQPVQALTTGLIETILPSLTSGGAGLVQTVAAPVDATLQTAEAVTSGLITTVLPGELTQASGTVLQTAETSVEAIAQTIDAAVVAPLDAATSGPLSDAGSTLVNDDLSGLLGSDPAGGVNTLVSLVSIDDMFDVADSSVLPASDLPPVPQLLDTLADETVESPLLGDVHDDDSPLGDLAEHDPLGGL